MLRARGHDEKLKLQVKLNFKKINSRRSVISFFHEYKKKANSLKDMDILLYS